MGKRTHTHTHKNTHTEIGPQIYTHTHAEIGSQIYLLRLLLAVTVFDTSLVSHDLLPILRSTHQEYYRILLHQNFSDMFLMISLRLVVLDGRL